MKNKKGFTLAEVLITLAIIGIVAAITIPSIVANHQKTALETQFAKAYRTVQQMINLAVAEHGGIETWDWSESWTQEEKDKFVKKYFVPYLNVVKFCPSDKSVTGCFTQDAYKTLNGASGGNISTSTHPQVLLADGSAITFGFTKSTDHYAMGINFETNGHKKPNTIGYDYFSFNLFKESGKFAPGGLINNKVAYNQETQSHTLFTDEERDANCGGGGNGWYCAAKVVAEGFKINY